MDALKSELIALRQAYSEQIALHAEQGRRLQKALDDTRTRDLNGNGATGAHRSEPSSTGGQPRSDLSIDRATVEQVLGLITDPGSYGGHAFSVRLPSHVESGNTDEEPGRSGLLMLEDGALLGPAHAVHEDIVKKGEGRYSHWGDYILFSTSDNSDPRINGRHYHVVLPRRSEPVAGLETSDRPKTLYPIRYFETADGNSFSTPVPSDLPPGDANQTPGRSRLRLFENGAQLGPGHAPHTDIVETGEGRYSHWQNTLYFSTSDNSDPRYNGREYHILWAEQDKAGQASIRERSHATVGARARSSSADTQADKDQLEALQLQVYVLRSDFNRSVARVDELRRQLQTAHQQIKAAQEQATPADSISS